ncbi:MAG TPA: site-2 protease family protein [Acetobacteraceae bacterium]|jgi:Zn-dependent protease|nr:site-2 protease family protein [Acetobacteraceae bacterium]
MNQMLLTLALAVIPIVIAITLHEAAHGYVAWALGDDTAKVAGRLSLNPLVHVDPVGTLLLPGILLIGQLLTIGHVAFMFGWAKPVPVDARRFRNPRRMMAVVAAAGPVMNFFLAWVGALALYGLPYLSDAGAQVGLDFIRLFIIVNLGLGLFNLIPIPPLDGGRIAVGILPLPMAIAWARLERAGIFIVMLVVFLLPSLLRDIGIPFDPVRQTLGALIPGALRLVLQLAGHNVGT